MNELEKYRNKIIETNIPPNIMVAYGFDAAIALDLPMKFNVWYYDVYLMNFLKPEDEKSKDLVELKDKSDETKASQEEHQKIVYKYWIDNVYKPD